VEGICKERLGLRIESIDRDGAAAEPLIDDRSFESVIHQVRPEIDEEERADHPRHNRDRAERNEMLVLQRRCHCLSMTGGTL
jgi:hypothetical protein